VEKMKEKMIILLGMIFIAIAVANADFGETAGILNFGKLHPGENRTLEYQLINTYKNQTIDFVITHPNYLIVNPENGTIAPHSSKTIKVTAIGNEVGSYSGIIVARALQNATGMITFNVGLQKSYKFEVVETPKIPHVEIIGAMVIFLIFISIIYYKLKRR
jgi:hypothetical protein